MKDGIKNTVEQRREVYGDYETGVILRAEMMDSINSVYMESHGGETMPTKYQGYIMDQLSKLIRIAVTPTHVDSWHDIQGYALRVEQALKREQDQ